MPTLICYDITDNNLRARLAKKIIAQGLDRINKSVYLGTINESSLTTLEKELAQLLQTKGQQPDSLLVIPVTAEEVHRMRVYGFNDLDKDELSGQKTTLIV